MNKKVMALAVAGAFAAPAAAFAQASNVQIFGTMYVEYAYAHQGAKALTAVGGPSGGDLVNIDVLQALTLAGGMTPFASEDGIRIIRKVDGKSMSIPFQYSRVRKGGDLSQNITLKSGDVLLVP